VDENDDLIDPLKETAPEYGAKKSFPEMILENLKIAGVQQAHKEDKITFTALCPWPGDLVCAEGRFEASDEWPVARRRHHQPQATSHKTSHQPQTEELLSHGVPTEWLGDVRQADEEGLLLLAERLPCEAAEALLELATGGKPRLAQPARPAANPFDHPDAQRRFRAVSNVEELQRALEFPWEKWTVFPHPARRSS
jgi:hypothetical protein